MKELIERIIVKESDVEQKIEWLSSHESNGHDFNGINIILRYLLKQNEILKARLDLLTQENYLKNKQ